MQDQLAGLLDCFHLRTQLLLRLGGTGWRAALQGQAAGSARLQVGGATGERCPGSMPSMRVGLPPLGRSVTSVSAARPPACLPATMQRAACPVPRAPAQRADGPGAAGGAAAAVAAGVAPHAGWARGRGVVGGGGGEGPDQDQGVVRQALPWAGEQVICSLPLGSFRHTRCLCSRPALACPAPAWPAPTLVRQSYTGGHRLALPSAPPPPWRREQQRCVDGGAAGGGGGAAAEGDEEGAEGRQEEGGVWAG